MQPSDADLVVRCLDGDQQAYAAMLDRYRDRCYWTAWKFVKNAEDAADVVQEAFVKAFTMLERFDRNRAFFTWLYRIVVNVAIDHIRKRDARPAVALEDLGEFMPDGGADAPPEMAELGETRRDVYRALDLLPETYRTVLVLSEIEGHSCKDVGEMLGIPHATARWRLHHARKLFKDVWERRILKLTPNELSMQSDETDGRNGTDSDGKPATTTGDPSPEPGSNGKSRARAGKQIARKGTDKLPTARG